MYYAFPSWCCHFPGSLSDGRILGTCRKVEGLYILQHDSVVNSTIVVADFCHKTPVEDKDVVDLLQWHCRLGHTLYTQC